MKFFISIVLTSILAFAAGLQLPWWFIAVAAFIAALSIPQKSGKAVLAGFLGIFLLWVVLAFVIKNKGGDLITTQTAYLLKIKGNTILLIFVTGLIGGLVGGLGALTGSMGRKLISKTQS
jgi:hypothetical protein